MKKHLLFAIAFILLSTSSFCQTGKIKLSLSTGPSIPLGNFAKTMFTNSKSGYVKTGEQVQIGIGYGISKTVDITATIMGALNGINTGTMASKFNQTGFFAFYGTPRYYNNWQFDKKNWQTAAFILGAAVHLPFIADNNNKLTLTIHPAVGVAYAKMPALNGNSKTDTSYVVTGSTSASALSVGYMLSAGIGYKLSSHIQLSLNLSYFGTALPYKSVTKFVTATNGGLSTPGVYEFNNSKNVIIVNNESGYVKQTISTISPILGISFTL